LSTFKYDTNRKIQKKNAGYISDHLTRGERKEHIMIHKIPVINKYPLATILAKSKPAITKAKIIEENPTINHEMPT